MIRTYGVSFLFHLYGSAFFGFFKQFFRKEIFFATIHQTIGQ